MREGLKCAKCRSCILIEKNAYSSSETVWILDPDSLPQFVESAVQNSGWTKGKLNCPNCESRIGSFDFVGGVSDPVHLVRSKMDESLSTSSALSETLDRRSQTVVQEPSTTESEAIVGTSSGAADNVSTDDSQSVTESETVPSICYVTRDSSDDSTSASDSSASTMTSDDMDADVVEMDFVVGGGGDMRLVSRKTIKRATLLGNKKYLRAKKAREEKFMQEILNYEPELDDIDPSLICPVCLDLLHDPFSALPCKHAFCETCLRRLGSKNAMDTACPMCRQRIVFCEIQKDLGETIRLQFPDLYDRRKKFEKTNPAVYNMPLPWRPGWRNLISGRPMGGNRFDSRSSGEMIQRIIQQLPYYIPPVVLANLINLVFFVFLLFAVEIVPTLLGLLMKKRNPNLQAQLRPDKAVQATAGAVASTPDLASGEIQNDYEDELVPSLDAMSEDVILNENPGGQSYYPSPEDATQALDTTFYYALYLVLLVGTLLGNFFLFHNPATFIPRGSFLERWFYHPHWGAFNRRILDVVLIIAITTVPVVILPWIIQERIGFDIPSWITYPGSYITFPYLFVAVGIVWLVSAYIDCQNDDLD